MPTVGGHAKEFPMKRRLVFLSCVFVSTVVFTVRQGLKKWSWARVLECWWLKASPCGRNRPSAPVRSYAETLPKTRLNAISVSGYYIELTLSKRQSNGAIVMHTGLTSVPDRLKLFPREFVRERDKSALQFECAKTGLNLSLVSKVRLSQEEQPSIPWAEQVPLSLCSPGVHSCLYIAHSVFEERSSFRSFFLPCPCFYLVRLVFQILEELCSLRIHRVPRRICAPSLVSPPSVLY